MAGWYEVQEGDEVAHVRATNTRTAIDRGFRLLCGMNYTLEPGTAMTIRVMRLSGRTEKVKLLEKVYQESRKRRPRYEDDSPKEME
jgi:methionine aminopeptidase